MGEAGKSGRDGSKAGTGAERVGAREAGQVDDVTRESRPDSSQDQGSGRAAEEEGRRVYLVRHGERLDRLFPKWLELGFAGPEVEGEAGKEGGGEADAGEKGRGRAWTPYDLNLPLALPRRPGGYQQHALDPPLTEMGALAGGLVGRGLGLLGHRWTAIYVAPQLRCVQTAAQLRRSAGLRLGLRVEPGLWDSPARLPTHIYQTEELAQQGFPVDASYQPLMSMRSLRSRGRESGAETAERLARTVGKLADGPSGAVLLVGPAGMLDAGGRGLLGLPPLVWDGDLGLRYPYLSVLSLRRPSSTPAKDPWLLSPDLPPLTYFDVDTRVRSPFLPYDLSPAPTAQSTDKPIPKPPATTHPKPPNKTDPKPPSGTPPKPSSATAKK